MSETNIQDCTLCLGRSWVSGECWDKFEFIDLREYKKKGEEKRRRVAAWNTTLLNLRPSLFYFFVFFLESLKHLLKVYPLQCRSCHISLLFKLPLSVRHTCCRTVHKTIDRREDRQRRGQTKDKRTKDKRTKGPMQHTDGTQVDSWRDKEHMESAKEAKREQKQSDSTTQRTQNRYSVHKHLTAGVFAPLSALCFLFLLL